MYNLNACKQLVWKAAWCYSRFRNIVGIVFCLWNGCDVYQIYRIIGDVLFLFSFWEIAEWWCTETEPPEQAMEPKPKAIILCFHSWNMILALLLSNTPFIFVFTLVRAKRKSHNLKAARKRFSSLVWGLHRQRESHLPQQQVAETETILRKYKKK